MTPSWTMLRPVGTGSGTSKSDRNERASRIFDPGAPADLLTVDLDGVHLFDDAELDHVATGWHRVGNVEVFAEVDQRRGIRHAELREAARNGRLLPTGVVVVRRGPVLLLADVVVVIPVHDEVAVDRKSTRLNSSHLGISYA